mmetsp:Transcript_16174/g.53265  ORF Transcript_16174/g.53265 Transcript_16174/m.53265 type:complete len:209 (-) Transcript_16174:233-859(-)
MPIALAAFASVASSPPSASSCSVPYRSSPAAAVSPPLAPPTTAPPLAPPTAAPPPAPAEGVGSESPRPRSDALFPAGTARFGGGVAYVFNSGAAGSRRCPSRGGFVLGGAALEPAAPAPRAAHGDEAGAWVVLDTATAGSTDAAVSGGAWPRLGASEAATASSGLAAPLPRVMCALLRELVEGSEEASERSREVWMIVSATLELLRIA